MMQATARNRNLGKQGRLPTGRLATWLDRRADRLFVLPAVLVILAFSIFPLLVSAYLAVSRFQLAAGGYRLRYIGWLNFRKLLFGSEQFHFLGVFAPVPWYGWLLLAAGAWFLLRRLVAYLRDGRITAAGILGRLIGAAVLLAILLLFAATLGPGASSAPSASPCSMSPSASRRSL